VKESPAYFDGLDHGVTEEVDEPAEALRGKGLGKQLMARRWGKVLLHTQIN
jgi:hypothetical protein